MALAAIVLTTQSRVELNYNGHIVYTPSRVPDLDTTVYGTGINDR
jgi:hypothetical protein